MAALLKTRPMNQLEAQMSDSYLKHPRRTSPHITAHHAPRTRAAYQISSSTHNRSSPETPERLSTSATPDGLLTGRLIAVGAGMIWRVELTSTAGECLLAAINGIKVNSQCRSAST